MSWTQVVGAITFFLLLGPALILTGRAWERLNAIDVEVKQEALLQEALTIRYERTEEIVMKLDALGRDLDERLREVELMHGDLRHLLREDHPPRSSAPSRR